MIIRDSGTHQEDEVTPTRSARAPARGRARERRALAGASGWCEASLVGHSRCPMFSQDAKADLDRNTAEPQPKSLSSMLAPCAQVTAETLTRLFSANHP